MKIDWKAKLTSRKFWLAIVGFITPLMLAMGFSQSTTTQASAIVMAGGTLIAYIIGEGMVDAAHAESEGEIISIIDTSKGAEEAEKEQEDDDI